MKRSVDPQAAVGNGQMAGVRASLSMVEIDARDGGVRGRYALCRPNAGRAAVGNASPCIVFLHGRGESGTDGFKPCMVGLIPAAMMNASSAPRSAWGEFVIIAPQKPDGSSTWEQNVALVMECLMHAGAMLAASGTPIDPSRTYLTGMSQGGAGTWAIAARHPERFAAIAPVCGFVHDPAGAVSGRVHIGSDAERSRIAAAIAKARTPVWAFHGEKDDVVLPQQTRLLVAATEQAGGEARATYFPEANHNSWDPAYRDRGAELGAWLLTHRKP